MTAKARGFTLVEIIIAIALAGIIAVGVIGVSGGITGKSATPMVLYQSVAITESYLDEILSKEFAVVASCPAVPSPGGRASFTHICHYNGLSDTGAKDQDGDAIANLENYNVSVSVAESANLGPAGQKVPAAANLLITVSVDGPADNDAIVSAYRSNF